jgi:membrane-bound inhibitor of C-type lysozyme
MKKPLAALLGLLALMPMGAPLALAAPRGLAGIDIATRSQVHYTCDGGKTITARYLNARNGQSFALLRIKGKTLLFVNTLSASGARYAAGRYVWWTKGPGATLYDEMAGENAPPMLANCRSRWLSKT